jgi:hypothetical protein
MSCTHRDVCLWPVEQLHEEGPGTCHCLLPGLWVAAAEHGILVGHVGLKNDAWEGLPLGGQHVTAVAGACVQHLPDTERDGGWRAGGEAVASYCQAGVLRDA